MKKIGLVVAIIIAGIYLTSVFAKKTASTPTIDSDEPIVILISIDGYRADYLDLYPSPNLTRMLENGVRAEALIPAHPTKTFPNHYTLVTGLYPSQNGIVANVMYDPEYDEVFKMSKRHEVENSRWWEGEPLWVTAELQGVKAATYFWPGSEAPIKNTRPSFWKRYDGSVPGEDRVDEVLGWLDLEPAERPRFITLYFSEVDSKGHSYGPSSNELQEAIQRVDGYLGRLLDGISARGIGQQVNVIVVSDHGMAETSHEKLIFLDDYISLDDVEILESTPMLVLKGDKDVVADKYQTLLGAHPSLSVYWDDDYPVDWHWQGHRRIPGIVAMADVGWTLIKSRDRYRVGEEKVSPGVHGYERRHPSMHSIFVAQGPAFPEGKVVESFENIHIYPLVTHLLDLQPAEVEGKFESVKHVLK